MKTQITINNKKYETDGQKIRLVNGHLGSFVYVEQLTDELQQKIKQVLNDANNSQKIGS